MHDSVIVDTSCLIILEKIGHLWLLEQLYQNITLTSQIVFEFHDLDGDFVKIEEPDPSVEKAIAAILDPGEASGIALALGKQNPLIIIDDLKARKVALSFDLKVTGTLGLLIRAKKDKLIPSLSDLLDQIQKTNFRISDQLIALAKKEVGE